MNDPHPETPAGAVIYFLQTVIDSAKEASNDRGSIVSLCMELKNRDLPSLISVLRHHPCFGPGAADIRKPLGIDIEQAGRG